MDLSQATDLELLAETLKRMKRKATDLVDLPSVVIQEMAVIRAVVADVHGIPHTMITERNRTRRASDARFHFCAAARQMIPCVTFEEIGRYIRRDHGTVIHALKAHKNRLNTAKVYKILWDDIVEKIAQGQRRSARQLSGALPRLVD